MIAALRKLVHDRAVRSEEIVRTYEVQSADCRERAAKEIERRTEQHDQQHESLNAKYMTRLENARRKFDDESARIGRERQQASDTLEMQFGVMRESLELELRQAQTVAERSFEQDIRVANGVAEHAKESVANELGQFDFLRVEAQKMLMRRRFNATLRDARLLTPDAPTDLLLKRYRDNARRCGELLTEMNRNLAVRFVDEGWPVLAFVGVLIVAAIAFGLTAGFRGWVWAAAAFGTAFVVALLSRMVSQRVACRQTAQQCGHLYDTLELADTSLKHAADMIDVERSARHTELETRRIDNTKKAEENWELESARIQSQHRTQLAQVNGEAEESEKANRAVWDAEATTCRETYPPMMERAELEHQHTIQRIEFERDARLAELADVYHRDRNVLVEAWNSGVEQFRKESARMNDYCRSNFPAFDSMDWSDWSPSSVVPAAIPFGSYEVDMSEFPAAQSDRPLTAMLPSIGDDARVPEMTALAKFELPAVLSLPNDPSLLILAEGAGRHAAVDIFQQTMLRMLTSLPAGKVRFTIVDPTGLGQNFSGFMHLADFDERLVTNRIWTESSHINQRLSDLTEHMENVIQKYLRNEFHSIQQYNEFAGEVAEPFHVLVVANFPTNFSDEAARRLVSVATSGARCGVFTLIGVDSKMQLPRNFELSDLEAQANTLYWDPESSQFGWKDPSLSNLPLTVASKPHDELATEIIRAAGQLAAEADRVEVPFATVAPPRSDWWTSDSRRQLEVAIGRAGATKLQFMSLGKGTSQHLLVAGKTGSGKSTLMHAIITNLSLLYSPHELQFYLVDFKKGVEFKSYAELRLPHAKVVAIESEREFGLSVLQRLDQELRLRGDAFREAGVQTVAAYREAMPDAAMPRLMLVVDEFQEFFVSEDSIANECGLLLDRLVRQGRAFGIHVLLGSQTLAGAYSLARSTLGQMAVRIALQCSESDAHLILSEENTAARLLNRPGEAIYNNANGLFEGNHPFQVVWLPDEQRQQILVELTDVAKQFGMPPAEPIVFEGAAAARLDRNVHLRNAMAGNLGSPLLCQAWLGAAVAIKDPTTLVLRRKAGNHLLVVGQNEALADGVLTAAILGLAVTCRNANRLSSEESATPAEWPAPQRSRFLLFDGGRFEPSDWNLGARLAKCMGADIENVDSGSVETTIAQIYEEVSRRTEAGDGQAPRVFLTIYNLACFRQLRRGDDDFGLGSFGDAGKEVSAAQQLAHILRDGPAVGVHLLVWCDSYNNLNRWFDRATLRDFAFRVLFQMTGSDSSNLMDSTAAAQLGQFRAVFYSDERGDFEKFQPYGLPSNDWLREVGESLFGPGSKPMDTP